MTSQSHSAVRVGIQSTDRLRREAIAAHVESLATFSVVGRLASHDDAASFCVLERPDVLLLDAARDTPGALAACRAVVGRTPEVRLILLYETLTAPDVAAARAAGVAAAVSTSHGLRALVSALRETATGTRIPPPGGTGLSDRQREILLLIASGHSAVEIGRILHISPGTVENHKRRLYAKLNASSAVHAIARAASYGIIDDRTPARGPTDPAQWAEGPTPSPDTERIPLVVAAGTDRETVDRVMETLIVHQFPVFREHSSAAAQYGHWWRWHHGPVVRVLVNPTRDHWQIGTALGRSAVVVHSGQLDRAMVIAALSDGASAVVPADQVEEQLAPVVGLVAKGYLVVDQQFAGALTSTAHGVHHDRRAQQAALTSREQDILRSIGDSHTVRQTALRLGIAVKTVENAQGNLFRKLGVHNRAEALASAYSLGLLQPAGGAGRDGNAFAGRTTGYRLPGGPLIGETYRG